MFKFSFSGDDIEEEYITPESEVAEEVRKGDDSLASEAVDEALKPELFDISELLKDLPSRISYSLLPIAALDEDNTSAKVEVALIPRREVFDIKVQIMADEDVLPNLDAELDSSNPQIALTPREKFRREELRVLLSNTEDLRTKLYEGGLKSWEGATDLTEYIAGNGDIDIGGGVLELGCGSALPSLYLFQRLLQRRHNSPPCSDNANVCFILADYNYSVLRLMTAPNMLLSYYNIVHIDSAESIASTDLDLEITPELITEFLEFMRRQNIQIKLISGAWSSSGFSTLLGYDNSDSHERLDYSLVLASETIYSDESTNAFTPLLVDSVSHWQRSPDSPSPRALVAAKEVYFGVGGTARQFLQLVEELGASASTAKRIKGRKSGVTRVIMEIAYV
ncbi:uncharacterized protein V1518DRAFT_410707 [Limtongia smithiae]|uniref:uncharacterized protein n=1 Tax=Limtongia smithiae TaxID=1125753 RepID=UPI0034CD2B50